ncbi:MAG: LysR family transcriptional regulator [Oscillospiraceae bacterium]|nr:LysR family transcriptional regulator [Oscillospiraceae bacterium]
MKFDYLREFVSAAQSSEMQQSAKELGISPSVLSKHIKSLEQELGVPLFTRSRKTELSPYGKILLPYAKELVKLQEEYLQDFSANSEAEAPKLVVGLSPIQFRERSGQLIEKFMLSHPKDVQMREADNASLCQMVEDGTLDMAFVRTQPTLHRSPELIYMPFCSDHMVAFLPPEHPLAHAPSINIEDLKNEHILLRSDKSTIYRVYTAACNQLGIKPNISFASTFIIYDMVRRGEGITLYLAPPADTKRSQQQLAIVPIHPSITSYVDIVFRPRHLPQLGLELLHYAQNSAAEWYRAPDSESGDKNKI